jgi:hypothetical protein
MEQALAAAAITTEPAERVLLLRAVATALRDSALEGGWAAAVHARASADLAAELRIDKAYSDLTSTTIATATARAARADVTGVQSLVQTVLKADDRLGRRRPQETAALLALLDLRLDEARRLRLARDAWVVRRQMFRTYRSTMAPALLEMGRMASSLESIRQLAGPAPGLLPRLEQRVILVRQQLAAITPPVELQAAHELFTAAFQMARRAASGRRNAILSGDMKLAWDASSAAAGALMLLDRARQELDRLTAAPSPR